MLLHSTFWCEIKVFKTKAVVGGSGDKRLSFITRLANDPTDGERHDRARVFYPVPNKPMLERKGVGGPLIRISVSVKLLFLGFRFSENGPGL